MDVRIFFKPLFGLYLLAQAILLFHYFSRVVLHQTNPRAGLSTFIPFILGQLFLFFHLMNRWDFTSTSWVGLSGAVRVLVGFSWVGAGFIVIFYLFWALARRGVSSAKLVKTYPLVQSLSPPYAGLEWVGLRNQVYDLSVNEYEAAPPRWPKAWSGLRVAHLTDVHHGQVLHDGHLREIRRAVQRTRPDLIAFTGDFVSTRRDLPQAFKWLEGLKAPLGVWAVLGNHEGWTDREAAERALRKAKIKVLKNEAVLFKRRGRTLALLGADDLWTGDRDTSKLTVQADARILLAHQPDHFFLGKHLGVNLQLSGHNHGGQICLPGGRALVAPSRYGARYASGFFMEEQSLLFVNRGVGASPPLRLFCPPEAALLNLRTPG